MARDEGWLVNNKRIHRLWRAEGLKVPYRKRKRPLRGIGVAMGAMCPIRPNVLWALDFQFDQTTDGQDPEAAQRHRRVHPGVPGHRSRPHHRRRRRRGLPRAPGRTSAVHLPTCASTTVPSSSPTPWPTGAASTAPHTVFIDPGSAPLIRPIGLVQIRTSRFSGVIYP